MQIVCSFCGEKHNFKNIDSNTNEPFEFDECFDAFYNGTPSNMSINLVDYNSIRFECEKCNNAIWFFV